MEQTVTKEEISKIIYTDHFDPFAILGPHVVQRNGKQCITIRAFLPDAIEAWVLPKSLTEEEQKAPMRRLHDYGFFECIFDGTSEVFPYELMKKDEHGVIHRFHDSYSFLPTLTDFDLYLFNKGEHHRMFDKLGAHYAEIQGLGGVQFAVWAPNARSVSVIGDFNNWDRRMHAMRVLGSSGVWELFVPGLPESSVYKFQIKTKAGFTLDKTDPYGVQMERRPRTASIVNFLRGYEWGDEEWMTKRRSIDWQSEPISIYEVHLGSWMRVPEEGNRWLTYKEAAEKLVAYVRERNFTHIELLPVMEHPFDGSWGYQVTGYYAPTSRFGPPQDFMHFVDVCHQNRIGVILDWVPAHFPKDSHALNWFDGTNLYEHSDPRKGEHPDWGTLIFNYGRNEVRNFLISNALFWCEKYHVDGLRIDAVASMLYLDYSRRHGEWVPNQYGGRENLEAIEFLKTLNHLVHAYFPGVLTIAEESTAWPAVTHPTEHGGLGFDFKWNMGWMHDTLEYFDKDPIYRTYHQRNLTFALLYAFTEKFLLPLSHDEVVFGKRSLLSKMPGDDWQKFANLRLLLALQTAFPGKKLLFMGGEFGQWNEWYHETSLDWHLMHYDRHAGVRKCCDDLHALYKNEGALHEVDTSWEGFSWIDFKDEKNSIVAFERISRRSEERITVLCNFTPVPHDAYRIGVTQAGTYVELMNTDSQFYGGGNIGNAGILAAENIPSHGRNHSLVMSIPPLAAVFLKRIG